MLLERNPTIHAQASLHSGRIACISAALLALTGCDPREKSGTLPLTPEDVAWAAGWSVYKWKLTNLVTYPVQSVDVVVLGPDGEVVSEGPSVMNTKDGFADDTELTFAFARRQSSVEVKLRSGGMSVHSTTQPVFGTSNWGTSTDYRIQGEYLVIAADGPTTSGDAAETLAMKCHKLCLRFKKTPPN